MAKAVFLDRDETLNPDPGYINDPALFSLYPWVAGELARLKNAGFKLMIISNQSGIGRGLITWDQLNSIHQKLDHQLMEAAQITIDNFGVCPHHPDDTCECRKPKPKLILDTIKKFNLDPKQCFMIGDRKSDYLAGQAANLAESFLIQPGDEASFKAAITKILAT